MTVFYLPTTTNTRSRRSDLSDGFLELSNMSSPAIKGVKVTRRLPTLVVTSRRLPEVVSVVPWRVISHVSVVKLVAWRYCQRLSATMDVSAGGVEVLPRSAVDALGGHDNDSTDSRTGLGRVRRSVARLRSCKKPFKRT